jgi:plastocyanin
MRNCITKYSISLLSISLSISSLILLFNISTDYFSFLAGKSRDTEFIGLLAFAENQSLNVIIPRGAASPEVDITKLSPTQWYLPSQISVNQNDSVTWINRDTEVHTVTSGIGAGLESLLNNKQGIKNGIFDSGIFKPGGNWTYKFVNPGTYQYFCTVHPWMEGTVEVKKGPSSTIPNYPVDAAGERQNVFPVHTLTKDNRYDIDMAWSPRVLLTGEEVSFILDFSDPISNKRHHLLPYDFVIFQNRNEVLRKASLSQAGSDVQKFSFPKLGPINIKVENVGDDMHSFTDFNSTVYENPSTSATGHQGQHQAQSNSLPTNPFKVNTLTLIWITYIIIGVIPAAVGVVYILYRKRII